MYFHRYTLNCPCCKLSGDKLSFFNVLVSNCPLAFLVPDCLNCPFLFGFQSIGAKLSVCLLGAKVFIAKLSGAKLSDAKLSGVKLSGVKLSGAKVSIFYLGAKLFKLSVTKLYVCQFVWCQFVRCQIVLPPTRVLQNGIDRRIALLMTLLYFWAKLHSCNHHYFCRVLTISYLHRN